MMNQPYSKALLERSMDRYVKALDSGNLDEIAAVLQIAEGDAELDRIIGEINWAYADELGLSLSSLESDQILFLLQEHFPSAFGESSDETLPITVSEVAAHLAANRLIPPTDQENSLKLLRIHTPLPSWLSLPEIRILSQQFGFNVSERFLKIFRDAAIQMSIGRGQAQMAATRRKTSRQYSRSSRSNEENHDTK
jgi:hypothetical protein